jgi:hypothetical protein
MIGDIVRSRRLASLARRDLQRRMMGALQGLNSRFSQALAAKFLITVGDEFQGLFRDPSVIPQVIRLLEISIPDVDLRVGVGRGSLDTDVQEYAIGMDGPAWHAARTAIDDAKAHRRLGGVFLGFGERDDLTLNGFARVLHHLRARLTARQRELLEALLAAGTQREIAALAGVSKQAVSKQARAAGWEAHREAEAAWQFVLAHPSTDASV